MAAAAGVKQHSSYEVARPGGKCAASGRDIQPGEKYMAALRETTQGLERLDVAPECWPEFPRDGLLGYWQTTMPHPQQKKQIFVDDEVLGNLFERLSDAAEPLKVHFRFVLGLILMRKRLLIYESSRLEGGRDIWSVRLKGRQDMLEMIDPKLNEQQVQEVSRQLSEILNEEL